MNIHRIMVELTLGYNFGTIAKKHNILVEQVYTIENYFWYERLADVLPNVKKGMTSAQIAALFEEDD